MADFCAQCTDELFGPELPNDFVGMTTKEQTLNDRFITVLCEGCGLVQVDHEGVCVTDCMRHHGPPIAVNT